MEFTADPRRRRDRVAAPHGRTDPGRHPADRGRTADASAVDSWRPVPSTRRHPIHDHCVRGCDGGSPAPARRHRIGSNERSCSSHWPKQHRLPDPAQAPPGGPSRERGRRRCRGLHCARRRRSGPGAHHHPRGDPRPRHPPRSHHDGHRRRHLERAAVDGEPDPSAPRNRRPGQVRRGIWAHIDYLDDGLDGDAVIDVA
jgi:hypothetical protein